MTVSLTGHRAAPLGHRYVVAVRSVHPGQITGSPGSVHSDHRIARVGSLGRITPGREHEVRNQTGAGDVRLVTRCWECRVRR